MLAPQIEDYLYVSLAARRARRSDGLAVLAQPEARADHGLQLYLRRYPERELEALYPLALIFFYPVGVGSGEAHLLVPEGREIQAAPRGGHPDERDLPVGAGEAHRVLHRRRGPHALEHPVRPAHNDRLADLRLVALRAEHGGEHPVSLLWMHHLVGSEPQGLLSLTLVLGDADEAPGTGKLPQRRDDEEADAAGPDHEYRVVRVRPERRVHGAGERLYRHRRLVGNIFRDSVKLGGMGDERPLRPAPAGVAAEAGLDAGGYRPLRNVHAQRVISGGAVATGRLYAAHRAAQSRLQHNPFAGAEVTALFGYGAHDLVAQDEGRGGDRGEIRRVLRRERPQIRAADAREKGFDAHPFGGRELGLRYLFEL